LRDVVLVFTNVGQDGGQGVLDEAWDRGAIDLKEELVEERRRSAHDVSDLVKALDAISILRDDTSGKVGADVAERGEGVGCRIPGAEFEGVEFKDGGVEGNDLGSGSSAIGNQEWHGDFAGDEVWLESDGGECVGWSSIGSVDELERERASPIVSDGGVEPRVSLLVDLVQDGRPVVGRADELDAIRIWPFED